MNSLFTKLLSPPPLKTDDYAFEAKYILSYRMCVFIAITVSFLDIILFLYFDFFVAIIALIFLGLVFVAMWHISVSRTFYRATLMFNGAGALICQITLFGAQDQPHITDPLWMTINILFAFLVLGYRWGLMLSVLHGLSIAVFFVFCLQNQLKILVELTDEQIYGISFNCIVCFSIIGFLGWQNIRINELSKAQLNQAQGVLQEQYNIISKQNEEKTTMLKEIHHRVKNNLQIITSLLRLQSRELESPEAIAKFKDATHRVIAMSMIHEKMYQSSHLSSLKMSEYLKDLSADLVTSYQSGYPVRLKIDCTVESIGLRSIVPLALILNELISNSLKYAFDNHDNCLISITLNPYSTDQCELIYQDSGTWKAPSRQGSFGLDLIESLTDQLEGTMKLHTFPETRFEFIFSPQED